MSPQGILRWALDRFGTRFAIATSFQKEGMAIVDMASRLDGQVRVFTLDTGRLPRETVDMIAQVRSRYGIEVEVVQPDPAEVDQMVSQHGLDLFYESVAGRRLCCEIRKVRPLQRKLQDLDAWASGLRREQSETRAGIAKAEEVDGRLKLHPLADWTESQLEDYLRQHEVPVHPLYAKGYATIGCDPCTRPVKLGEDPRAGRWWWEQDTRKECGIHFSPDGKAVRA